MQATTVQLSTAFFEYFERESEKEMATVFARGAQTMNTVVFKPIGRKHFHKNSSSADMIRETKKFEGDEVKQKNHMGENDRNLWVPHERTGIYYPKGHEKVMDEIPPGAVKDMDVNWFSNNEN
ncbi:hypothetical protein CerSpe_111940 [Prunus speciosa]